MDTTRNAAEMLGRAFLVALFIIAGVGKVGAYAGTAAYMEANGIPGFLLPLVIVTEIVGGALVLVGWHTRIVSFLMAGFTVLSLILFHVPISDQGQIVFFAELAAAGGFLLLVANGAGRWSVDALRQRAAGKGRMATAEG